MMNEYAFARTRAWEAGFLFFWINGLLQPQIGWVQESACQGYSQSKGFTTLLLHPVVFSHHQSHQVQAIPGQDLPPLVHGNNRSSPRREFLRVLLHLHCSEVHWRSSPPPRVQQMDEENKVPDGYPTFSNDIPVSRGLPYLSGLGRDICHIPVFACYRKLLRLVYSMNRYQY